MGPAPIRVSLVPIPLPNGQRIGQRNENGRFNGTGGQRNGLGIPWHPVQPSKASSRDWAHDPRAEWRSREKRNSRQGPPDKTAKTPSASLVGYRPTSWALTG